MIGRDGDCHYATHPPPSRAYITGKMLDSGLLEVEVTWEQTPALAATFVCPKRSWEVFADHPIIPDPEQFWVPSTGGTSRRNPALTGAETTDGIAIYTIIPEPGQ